jgi:hypothetical protein
MKFGKEFQQILEDGHFPEDWKSTAIEYRRVSDGLGCLSAWSGLIRSDLLISRVSMSMSSSSRIWLGSESDLAADLPGLSRSRTGKDPNSR